MSGGAWSAVLAAAMAVALLLPPAPRRLSLLDQPGSEPVVGPEGGVASGWLKRFRWCWALLAGFAATTFLGGTAGLAAGPAVAAVVWVLVGRSEAPAVRREREAVTSDLPHLVGLLGSALEAGHAPGPALALVCEALPGPAADRLARHPPRLALGLDPAEVWSRLAEDPELAGLGRALARAHATGAPVGAAVARLGDELAAAARADVEDRARRVGVQAAVPLGLCLLPAFVLLGIVPLVAGLVTSLELA